MRSPKGSKRRKTNNEEIDLGFTTTQNPRVGPGKIKKETKEGSTNIGQRTENFILHIRLLTV